jgi:hypothetical protein
MAISRPLFCFVLVTNLVMLAASVFVASQPRPKPPYEYPGWLATVGLALGNAVLVMEAFALLLCDRMCLPCLLMLGVGAFAYALVWGVHAVGDDTESERDFLVLVVCQVVHVAVLGVAVVAVLWRRSCGGRCRSRGLRGRGRGREYPVLQAAPVALAQHGDVVFGAV